MNLLFFQNIISPHQMPYIQHLPKMEGVEDVVVIVPEVNLGERDALGWNTKRWLQTEGVKFVVSPSLEEVEDILKNYDNENDNENGNGNGNENGNGNVNENGNGNQTWCLFSGINAFPAVAEWFRLSRKYQVKRGVITEPPYVYEHPLWQHAIRFALQDWKYVKYIDKIFVMGDDYLQYYRFWSKRWEVIPFMYCTEGNGNGDNNLNVNLNENQNGKENGNGNLKVLYVGALSKRKNVRCLLKAAMLLNHDEQEQIEVGIVGDGEQRQELEQMARHTITKIHFYGSRPMENIPAIMEQYDVLVLPSLHDGWGAVVNEALTLGLYVICSDHCGAKYLLKGPGNGIVFSSDNAEELKECLLNSIQNMQQIRKATENRTAWSKEHISGEAVARYFINKVIA